MDCFPAVPAAWYLFGRADELRRGPVSKDLLRRKLVGYRTESGAYVVLDGRCSHLGADLACGQVVGERIRCPFHHWEYAADGRCRRIPSQPQIPEFARQQSYPVCERHGLLFFYAAADFKDIKPSHPLPFFSDCDERDFIVGRPFTHLADCAWYMVSSNAFDGQHFSAVHDRRLLRPPLVDCPHPFARRIRFDAEVVGDSIFDRLLRRFVGSQVKTSITCWGGPLVLVTGSFRGAQSYILISLQPTAELQTRIDVVVLARKSDRLARRLLAPLGLELRRWFTQGFMRDDFDRLQGIRYNPAGLVQSDRLMIDFFQWLAALTGGKATSPTDSRDAIHPSGNEAADGVRPPLSHATSIRRETTC